MKLSTLFFRLYGLMRDYEHVNLDKQSKSNYSTGGKEVEKAFDKFIQELQRHIVNNPFLNTDELEHREHVKLHLELEQEA